ncbi:hypothetical protein JTB14_016629 [Gonioctena quinquepunctata]|nr:hypothetical protein JTB14_016629 [Gonioctena quinquepunctata]
MDGEIGAKEERAYFTSVLNTLRSYGEQSLLRIQHKQICLESLPVHHQKWLKKYKEDLEMFRGCIKKNADFIPLVLRDAHCIFENVYSSDNTILYEQNVGTLSEGLDKVQSVFKQLMRDWSSLGAPERQQCYEPIIKEIFQNYPEDKYDRGDINVLVPGAGLGRLAFEIASKGFSCQGNEFNVFMLIVSFFVLNLCKKVDEHEVYPWIHQYCNNTQAEHQTLSVRFPDVIPLPTPDSKFSMTAGDFLEVYQHRDEWHCVATCFFIDCAANVVEFIETIYKILKPGGLWINLGPLLYHYSDSKNSDSIEPSFEVLTEVIKSVGFEMEKCETEVKTKYCQNPKSMLQYEYDSVFFVCRKTTIFSPLSVYNMESPRTDIQYVESEFKLHTFRDEIMDKKLTFQLIKMKDSLLLYINDKDNIHFDDLSLGLKNRYDDSTLGTRLIGNFTEEYSKNIACKISKKLKKAVFMSCNLDPDRIIILMNFKGSSAREKWT